MRALLLICFLFFGLTSQAQLPKKNWKAIKQIKNQYAGLVSKRTYKFMERSYSLAARKNYKEAIKVLQDQIKNSHIKGGEKAQILRSLGFIYAQKEDFKNAVKFLKRSLATKKLSYRLHLSTLYAMAQITISNGNYQTGQKILEQWFSLSEKPRPDAYILYAVCLLEKKQEAKALKYVEKTIAMVAQPRESWLKFALSLNLKKGNYKKSKNLLERLIAQFPNRSLYWKHLAGVYIYLNDNKKALVTLEIAYKMGYLNSESEHLNLARLLMSQGMPFQAAQTLKKSVKDKKVSSAESNLELMADAYLEARESKISLSLFAKLIKNSNKQDTYVKYAYLLLQEEDWPQSEIIFRKALALKPSTQKQDESKKEHKEKGDKIHVGGVSISKKQIDKTASKKTPAINSASQQTPTLNSVSQNKSEFQKEYKIKTGKIHLGLGIALFYQKKYEEALKSFQKSFQLNSEQSAAFHWIQYAETAIKETSNQATI